MDTIKFNVPIKLIDYINKYLETNNLGNRGLFDGSKDKQKIGLIGEMISSRFLLGTWPDLYSKNGFDDGIDIIYKNRNIDIKTMERKNYVDDNYVNNFIKAQINYKSDTLLFCSYANKFNVLEMCGWIDKCQIHQKAILYKEGTIRTRRDGTTFKIKMDMYELPMLSINSIQTL